ncbi:MAG: 30S ribosomal protein S7 [Candidatus Daviesbacteria bacterium GW2011_GWA1_41_61]|uniref:Small ribosomal subunit protein uS7 n=1 Tax=Candidatus Daviesbacteria bacterium GW2011_GWA2_40_9 TaxID=1618424 RepID=A0A0G0X6Q7_9BACT|nr:MAG: 30S ribosomal protein S7 [Candidatus Daviesbacteria bacterium GW2011_GWA2_40_9]KKR93242.1 MAG: 30S ribosomal protein S7 [Candidatus Daviesbacteria bacterium GW2011_GWB1_41_15]KKS14730.1 MAG: 30S ribosomal protein S7 [Candidatus Daviesbacteria bacterium GW2011_GWA1_41_61]
MPRSGKITKRVVLPDPVYNSRLLSRFINRMMFSGKKTVAQNLVYQALEEIEKTAGKNPLTVFEAAISNVMPRMEVRPRRIGGASYQIPVEVRGDRKEALAVRWIIEAARNRSNKEYHTFDKKLAAEFLDASEGKGAAIKKKEDTLRVAEANRAFSHFKWQ